MKRLTRAQAAEYLGTSPDTLRRWDREGEGPVFYRLSEKTVYYLESDLSEWLESRRVEPRNDNAAQA